MNGVATLFADQRGRLVSDVSTVLALRKDGDLRKVKEMKDMIEHEGLQVRFVEVDKELAKKYLSSSNGNRNESHPRIDNYKRLMNEGKWCPFSTIIVNEYGNLRDGHHRLIAQSVSDKPNVFIEIRGFKEDWTQYIDVGRPRSAADFCKFVCELKDVGDLPKCVAIARFVIDVKKGIAAASLNDYKDIADFIFEEQDVLDETINIVRDLKKHGFRVNQGLNTAVYMILKRGNYKMRDFFDKLIYGVGLEHGNPILSFRDYMNSSKASGRLRAVNDYSNLAKCWNAYINREEIRRFRVVTDKVCESTKLMKARFE